MGDPLSTVSRRPRRHPKTSRPRSQAWRELGHVLGVEGRADELNAEARRCAGQADGWFVPFLVAAARRGWHRAGHRGCADDPS
ncbi:hypothetical protein [Micromonospora sp. NPDC005806]|uniref:hypothetical protein n=1 Tax=Micromonospora sp. NPDC005806 TaxID=3364234 RepID=UPI00367B3B2D